jgi:hypothetical protein
VDRREVLLHQWPRHAQEPEPDQNANCVISAALPDLDIVVEGTATKVSDEATLQKLAERYAAQGWPARTSDGAITADYSNTTSPWAES